MSIYTTPIYSGIDLDDNYGPQVNTVSVAFICISFVTIALRFLSRRVTRISCGLDDYLIILAAVLSWACTAVVINGVLYDHSGQHISKTDPQHLESWLKGLFAVAILYPIALTASKLSLLALLDRIFGINKSRIPMWIAAALNVSWMVAAILVGVFSCEPIRGFWDLNVRSTCIQEYDFFLANECITITLDLVVLLMPVYFISQIKKSLSQKISISSTFFLGLIATIVSLIRLWQLVVAQQRPGFDPTFNETGAALWAVIELNTWVVVSNIPSLRPLFQKWYAGFAAGSAFSSTTFGSHSFGLFRRRKAQDTDLENQSSHHRRTSRAIHINGRPRIDPYDILLSPDVHRDADVDLVEFRALHSIRVDRDFKIAEPATALRRG